MPEYLSPGVYIEEVPPIPLPAYYYPHRQQTSTTTIDTAEKVALISKPKWSYGPPTAAFVGYTERAELQIGRPILITNWSEFVKIFGEFVEKTYLPNAVFGFFHNGGERCWVTSVQTVAASAALPGDGIEGAGHTLTDVYNQALVELGRLDNEVELICAPDIMASYAAGEIDARGVKGLQEAVIRFCEQNGTCFAILDTPADLDVEEVRNWRRNMGYSTSYAALYYPWIAIWDQNQEWRRVPPSGYVAGIYARNDVIRGIHKSPANEVVMGAMWLAQNVTKAEQDVLDPIGINVLLSLSGNIRVWGARTLSNDSRWQYIRTRRLVNYLKRSIQEGTQWVIFEPYRDESMWTQITRQISDYLHLLWRSGAFFGASPAEAYFVKCDAETNPPEIRELGRIVVIIGLALTPPVSFYYFRIVYKS